MTNTQFKATLEMLIPLVVKEIMKNRNVGEQEAFELLYSSFLYSKLEVEPTKLWHLSQLTLANLLNEELETGSITMSSYAEFITYCLEEYKAAKGMTGKEVIMLFKQYNIIDYIVTCYGALHTMGGLAIADDIQSLIENIEKRKAR